MSDHSTFIEEISATVEELLEELTVRCDDNANFNTCRALAERLLEELEEVEADEFVDNDYSDDERQTFG